MSKRTFMIGIPTKFDTYEDWISDHDSKIRADERAKVIEKINNIKPYAENQDVENATEYILMMLGEQNE